MRNVAAINPEFADDFNTRADRFAHPWWRRQWNIERPH
jgi:hypothetical protein